MKTKFIKLNEIVILFLAVLLFSGTSAFAQNKMTKLNLKATNTKDPPAAAGSASHDLNNIITTHTGTFDGDPNVNHSINTPVTVTPSTPTTVSTSSSTSSGNSSGGVSVSTSTGTSSGNSSGGVSVSTSIGTSSGNSSGSGSSTAKPSRRR